MATIERVAGLDSPTSMEPSTFSWRGATKIYRTGRQSVAALSDFSLDAGPGEVVGLIGPNGAGKTTAMRLLVGLSRPTSGACQVAGKDSRELAVGDLRSVGVLLNPPRMDSSLTPRRWLNVLAVAGGFHRHAASYALERTGALVFSNKRIDDLSSGMRQRVGLSAALLFNPSNLVLDEPMTGLDPEGVALVRAEIAAATRRGGTVLVSSHQFSELEDICTRVAVLSGGSLVASGGPRDLIEAPRLIVRCADIEKAVAVLSRAGFVATRDRDAVVVDAVRDSAQVSSALANEGIFPTELRVAKSALEQAYFELTGES